jgi:toxin FitB
VNLIDSSAWLEYFAAGPQAQHLTAAIEDVERLLVPTIVLVEVTRRVMQQRDEDTALQIAAVLHQGQIVPLDSGIALSAAHFGGVHKLPLADSIIFATAKQFDATIWTLDAAFKDLPGVKYFSKSRKTT